MKGAQQDSRGYVRFRPCLVHDTASPLNVRFSVSFQPGGRTVLVCAVYSTLLHIPRVWCDIYIYIYPSLSHTVATASASAASSAWSCSAYHRILSDRISQAATGTCAVASSRAESGSFGGLGRLSCVGEAHVSIWGYRTERSCAFDREAESRCTRRAEGGGEGRLASSKMTRIIKLQLGQTPMSALSRRSTRVISNRSPQGHG